MFARSIIVPERSWQICEGTSSDPGLMLELLDILAANGAKTRSLFRVSSREVARLAQFYSVETLGLRLGNKPESFFFANDKFLSHSCVYSLTPTNERQAMDERKIFRRLAAFVKAWFGLSLNNANRGFEEPELQDAWVDSLAEFAIKAMEIRMANGLISIDKLAALDESLGDSLGEIFRGQVNLPLVPYRECLFAFNLGLAIEMLTKEDQEFLFIVLRSGPDSSVGDIAIEMGFDVRYGQAAWGRIADTLSGDEILRRGFFDE